MNAVSEASFALCAENGVRAGVEAAVATLAAAILGVPENTLARDALFSELGFDSARLLQLVARINEHFSLALTPVELFEFVTLGSLAAHLDKLRSNAPAERAMPPAGARAPASAAEPIAVIGMSGRFPGARDVQALWQNLVDEIDPIREIPPERWDWRSVSDDAALADNRDSQRWAGLIEGIDEFDPLFFNISPREARSMDPQQRLLLMHAWAAIEDAGHSPRALAGSSTGVFLAAGLSDYAQLLSRARQTVESYSCIGLLPSAGPNRVSHFLDLHGPSEAVETACSSSLVAVHRAVTALRQGDCDMALAGGVNTMLAPDNHISLGKAGALSKDGRCQTFSDRANGYVRSEGVAIVFLKRLSDAQRDGDSIYGLITGTAVNHSGRTSSLTAPGPQAQAELISAAWRRAGVDADSVGYVEAHGTGTPLGDPIEIAGLRSAFARHRRHGETPSAPHCGIGSIKSNIGHLELAAGVAGLIKVLLQIKHQTLVRTLHCERINPYIDLGDTALFVVHERQPWRTPVDGSGAVVPRRAGVSSFSVTGTNAHVVLEEHLSKEPLAAEARIGPYNIVLSAFDAPALRRQVIQLLSHIDLWHSDRDLRDLAYTLQVGREAMRCRLAIATSSLDHLRRKLRDYLSGETDTTGLDHMARVWLDGGSVDWMSLYRGSRPQRLHLPTYPFARERCWIDPLGPALFARRSHELLDPAATTLVEQVSVTLKGDEAFLVDHVVHGLSIVPGVVQLEMARAAGQRFLDRFAQADGSINRPALTLNDVSWLRPIACEAGGLRVTIELRVTPSRGIAFEIRSADASAVYAEGLCELTAPTPAPQHDLAAIRDRCSQASHFSSTCYETFERLGLAHGPSLRALSALHIGEDELLAELRRPEPDLCADWMLHPGLIDAATQAVLGFRDPKRLALPFHLDRLEVLASCGDARWAWVRRRSADSYDIEICDPTGRTCARLSGFAVRETDAHISTIHDGEVFAHVEWAPLALDHVTRAGAAPRDGVLIVGGTEGERAKLRAACPDARELAVSDALKVGENIQHIIWLLPHVPNGGDSIARQAEGALLGYRLNRALLAAGYDSKPLVWTVITTQSVAVSGEATDPTHAAVHGLIGSMSHEHEQWNVRLFDVPVDGWEPAALLDQFESTRAQVMALRANQWYRQQLVSFKRSSTETAPALTRGGVYVLIGGAGGIGEAWTEWAIRAYAARVAWVGRRALDPSLLAKLDRLAALGPRPIYVQADAADEASLARARDTIRRELGGIDGVIHAAMVLRDRTLANLSEQAFSEALFAKVATATHTAQVFRDERLDFLVFFSAFNSFFRSAGQSNYVAGCNFVDALALHLARKRTDRVRVMNWGYWGEVGGAASPLHRSRMERLGVGVIDADSAMRAFERLVASERYQASYLRLTRPCRVDGVELRDAREERVLRRTGASVANDESETPASQSIAAALTGKSRQDVLGMLLELLQKMCADVLAVPPGRLGSAVCEFAATRLGEFGMDSLLSIGLRNRLRQQLEIEVSVQAILGERAGQIAELMYERLLLQRITRNDGAAQTGEVESFVF
jgi:polyketide synthase PksN